MKRSISVTSINSTDSVIPIEVTEKSQYMQTRSGNNKSNPPNSQAHSKPTTPNNSYNSNTSLNNQQNCKRLSASPCSLIYVDSESTNFSDGINKNEVSFLIYLIIILLISFFFVG